MTWSSLDLAGHCRADLARKAAFDAALAQVVKRGDTVLDAGAGSGILSTLALKHGAVQVTAVERDPTVCACLQHAVRECRLPINVICGDARNLVFPRVDLLLAEMVDVWLLEEDYAIVIEALLRSGTILPDTKIIPCGYIFDITFGELVWGPDDLIFRWPHYEWPYYETADWEKPTFKPIASFNAFHSVMAHNFGAPNFRVIDRFLPIERHTAEALVCSSGVRLSGTLLLGGTVKLGQCGTLNAPLLLPLDGASIDNWRQGVRIEASLSDGLQSLSLRAGDQQLLSLLHEKDLG